MKRIFFILFISICCLFVLYSCGKDENLAEETVTLNVYTSFGEGDGNHDTYRSLVTQFENQNNVKISDHSQVSNETWKQDILSLFDNNIDPDVLFFFSGMDGEPLIKNQDVVDLETIRSQYPSYASNINTSVLNTMKASDGKVYAVPVMGYWEGLFINQDLFDQYNIEIPENWDSFLAAVSAFKQQGIIPIAVSLGEIPHYWFELLIYNHSGPVNHLSSVPTSETPLSSSWVEGLKDLQVLYQMGAFPADTADITDNESFELFQSKKAAMVLDGSWSVGKFSDTQQVILIPFPSRENGVRKSSDMIGGFSMGFYITKAAWEDPKKQKACVDFINTMTSNESIVQLNKNGSAPPIPANPSEDATPLLQSISAVNRQSTAYISAVQDTLNLSVRNQLFAQIPDIASGKVSIEDALEEFVRNNTER